MFSGKLDRFDFKLVGKKEVIMPYNSYQLQLTKAEDLLKPNFVNPDKMRWELHRAWVVEATLKPGKRHIYSKRTFYWDEDWGGGMVDLFDATGKIWRGKYAMSTPVVRHSGADHGIELHVRPDQRRVRLPDAHRRHGRPQGRATAPIFVLHARCDGGSRHPLRSGSGGGGNATER